MTGHSHRTRYTPLFSLRVLGCLVVVSLFASIMFAILAPVSAQQATPADPALDNTQNATELGALEEPDQEESTTSVDEESDTDEQLDEAPVLEPTAVATATESPLRFPTLSCQPLLDPSVAPEQAVHLNCEVVVSDSRLQAFLVVTPSAGWLIDSAEGSPVDFRSVGPLTSESDIATTHSIAITIQSPAQIDAIGNITVSLRIGSEDGEEIDNREFELSTFLPDDWVLQCGFDLLEAIPGEDLIVSCSFPEAAWNLRSVEATSSVKAGSLEAVSTMLEAAAFSVPLSVPCDITEDTLPISVAANLAPDLTFTTSFSLPVNTESLNQSANLSIVSSESTNAIWNGTAYSPAQMTVEIAVDAPVSNCVSSDWSVAATVSDLSDGADGYEIPFIYIAGESSTAAISSQDDLTLTPGISTSILSGTGSGNVLLILSIKLPADSPTGNYSGALSFEITGGL